MTTICFISHEKRQLVDFLKKYPCIIYVKNALNVAFKSLHSKKTKKYQSLDHQIQQSRQVCFYQKMFQKFLQKQYFPEVIQ